MSDVSAKEKPQVKGEKKVNIVMWKFAVGLGSAAAGAGMFYWKALEVKAAQQEGNQGSLQTRFRQYASVGRGDLMTPDDFFDSCCPSLKQPMSRGEDATPRKQPGAAETSAATAALLKRIDADGDGLISFSEYCLLFSLLSTESRIFRTAFHMFDRDESGALDASEFQQMILALSVDPSAQFDFGQSGFLKSLFGSKLDGVLSLKEFLSVVDQLRWGVRQLEFRLFEEVDDAPGRGSRNQAQGSTWFGRAAAPSIASGATASPPRGTVSLPNVQRLIGVEAGPGGAPATDSVRVSWGTYLKLFDVVREAETVQRALSLLEDSKRAADPDSTAPLGATKSEFVRALRAADLSFTAEDVDIFYKIFDLDNSGTIDADEFRQLCKLRRNFFAAYVPRFTEPQRNVVQQFSNCMQQRQ